ncbi:MAG: molybdopterin-guanine dinucleotide biosynthesis protein A [Alphaproteobacteria bacterium]|nr:molybdopterin-guanine dinucleotide biosynthesis protein A [Alphaproteobacteria bacterium]MDP6812386.1 molybdopterin-guanine dinucleotide biosynthesis protein A [Alphaproteobacteria bacterium]
MNHRRFALPITAALLLIGGLCAGIGSAAAADRHAGYYYPEPTSSETYRARSQVLPNAGRDLRIGFVVAQTIGQRERNYPPRFAMFAKGEEAEKLIIVGLDAESFATLYRARAVLAQMTAAARGTELFRNLAVEDYFTFFDLARMLGFSRITVSDGKSYAHRIDLE